jgi:hypothetical protein
MASRWAIQVLLTVVWVRSRMARACHSIARWSSSHLGESPSGALQPSQGMIDA